MSVVKGDRSPTEEKFETGAKYKELCGYTVTTCKNENYFPKRNRWLLTQPIVNMAVKAYANIKKANSINVASHEDYKLRRKYQIKAMAQTEAMLGLIEIASLTLDGLSGDRVEYWTSLIVGCETMLTKWRDADRRRYKQNFGNKE